MFYNKRFQEHNSCDRYVTKITQQNEQPCAHFATTGKGNRSRPSINLCLSISDFA